MNHEEQEIWRSSVENLIELRDSGTEVTNWEFDFIGSMEEKLHEKPFFITIRQRDIIREILEKYEH